MKKLWKRELEGLLLRIFTKKMRKEIFQIIEIPENVEITLEKGLVIVKGKNGENRKRFDLRNLEMNKDENKIRIGCKEATKKEKKMINTITAHIRNMIKGVLNKFEYQLKVCFSHFPITVEAKGNNITIKNFLGEKLDRKTKIPEGAEIKINKEMITITSVDKEIAGQAAANIERTAKVRNRDRRVFQDGIFIINKAGKEI